MRPALKGSVRVIGYMVIASPALLSFAFLLYVVGRKMALNILFISTIVILVVALGNLLLKISED